MVHTRQKEAESWKEVDGTGGGGHGQADVGQHRAGAVGWDGIWHLAAAAG